MSTRTRLLSLARDLATAIDDLPISPASLSRRAIDHHFDRRRARVITDPTWSAIQTRRQVPGGASSIFLSKDLTIADDAEQRRIAAAKTPDPRWLPLARRAQDWRAASVLGATANAAQRTTRGWADSDTYSLDTHLCRVLGGMLKHLADNAHGWPDGDEFPTFEDWVNALRTNAAALLAYAAGEDEELLSSWYELSTTRGSDPAAIEAARRAMDDDDAARHVAAQTALHWVADNLGRLWD